MRLPAPRERRRSTVLGQPFLRAVSAGAQPDTPETEPPQHAEASEPQSLDPFRAMVNLFNACQQADAEIAEIEETLAVDPDALPPEAIVAPAQKLLALTQSDIDRLPPGKASEHVIRTAQREGLEVSGRVLEADARARQRFTTGAISDAADRLAARVSEDPAALKPSLEMLNDLIDTADLDPSDKRLIKANLESRVLSAAELSDANPDAPISGAGQLEQVVRDGKSDALTPPSEAGDVVEIAPQREPGLFEISPETAEQIASRIRKLQAALDADRGDGKSLLDAQEEFANQVDRLIEEAVFSVFGEDGVAGRDEFNAAFERGYRELRQWLHGEIDRIGEENGYSDRHIANLKLMADTTVVTISIVGPGERRGRGGRDGDPDGRDDPEAPENEQGDRDAGEAKNEDEPEDGEDGSRSDEDDAFDRIDVSKIKVPKIVKARDPLTGEELAAIIRRGEERVDPHRLRTLQATAGFKFSPDDKGRERMLVHTVREFFTKKDLAASLPEIRIFVDGEGKVWTLDHRRVVAARVATQVAQRHGLDMVFKLRFKVVELDDPHVRRLIKDRLKTGALEDNSIRDFDGLSIEVTRPRQR